MISSPLTATNPRLSRSPFKTVVRGLLTLGLVVLLTACGAGQPPLNYGPDRAIIKKAIAWQLERSQTELAEQLGAAVPEFHIKKFKTKGIEPIYIKNLATYHLQGSFDYQLDLASDRHEQKHQDFDVYLQRQRQGQSWRILVPIADDSAPSNEEKTSSIHRWRSYLVQ